jgi:hypothetical protein
MVRAVAFVAAHPGCAKIDVAAELHGADGEPSGGYATVNRAIACGLLGATLRAQRGPRCYSLQVTPLGHQLIRKVPTDE